jgi:hypothetical protein
MIGVAGYSLKWFTRGRRFGAPVSAGSTLQSVPRRRD